MVEAKANVNSEHVKELVARNLRWLYWLELFEGKVGIRARRFCKQFRLKEGAPVSGSTTIVKTENHGQLRAETEQSRLEKVCEVEFRGKQSIHVDDYRNLNRINAQPSMFGQPI